MIEITNLGSSPRSSTDMKVLETARNLETSFLSEMLKGAGLNGLTSEFGGGSGEDQFMSFMREAQAKNMVNAGGIGLAEVFYQAMKREQK